MTPEIIPSLLVESSAEFERRLRLVEEGCTTVHVDVMDGTLVPHTSWFDALAVGEMRTPVAFELHLMVENPLPIITAWKKHVMGIKRAIIHAEIHRPLGAVLEQIREVHKLETGVALNPETPLLAIEGVIHALDQLTLLGVHPGASDQAFLGESVLAKIRDAHEHRSDLVIEIDGGVTLENIQEIKKTGVSRFCAAHLLFAASDPAEALKRAQSFVSTRPA